MHKGHSDASACVLEGRVTQGQKHSSYPDPQILAAAPCAWEEEPAGHPSFHVTPASRPQG